MTGGAMQRPVIVVAIWAVFGAYRIVRTEAQFSHRGSEENWDALGHAAKAAERPLSTGRRRVDQDAEAVGLLRPARVDALLEGRERITAV